MSRKKEKSGGRGGIFIIVYFIALAVISFVFQYKVINGDIVLDFIPTLFRETIFKNILWYVMIISLFFFWGLFVLNAKIRERKFNVEDRYYNNIPTNLPPSAAVALVENESPFALGAEFTYFIEKGYIEIIEKDGRTTFKANRYPTEKDGLWKYQIELFNLFFKHISGSDGVIDLDDLEKIKNDRKLGGIYFFNFVGSLMKVQDELKEKGYIKKRIPAFLDFDGMSSMLPFLPILYLCLGYVVTRKLLISIPLIIYFVFAMTVCKDRTGNKDRLTNKGIEEFNKVSSFKLFLQNYAITEDRSLRDLKLLKLFLVYASAFGLSDKIYVEVSKSGIGEVFGSMFKSMLSIKFDNIGNYF